MNMKTIKVNRDLLNQFVNGRMNIIHWDVQENAKRILKENRVKAFRKYVDKTVGKNATLDEIVNCLIDYDWFGAYIKFNNVEDMEFFGMTANESLYQIFKYLYDLEIQGKGSCLDLEGKKFTITGVKGEFTFYYCYMHYLFAKERISVKDALEYMRVKA